MTRSVLIAAISAAMAGAAMATDPLLQSDFESGVDGWEGDGGVVDETPATPVVGFPLPNSEHARTLAVTGTVTRATGAGAEADMEVDMMVKVSIPLEDSELLDIMGENQRIVVAVNASSNFVAYCTAAGGSDRRFVPISETRYGAGEWVRVGVVFDYVNQCAKITLNGYPACSSYGYANQTCAIQGGAWYRFATAGTSASAVDVAGATSIDDVVVRNTPIQSYCPPIRNVADLESSGVTVPAAYLYENGLASNNGTDVNGVGLTVGEAYAAGVDYSANEAFEILAAEPAADGVILSFPGVWNTSSYIIKCTSDVAGETPLVGMSATVQVRENGTNRVKVSLPGSGVAYYSVTR